MQRIAFVMLVGISSVQAMNEDCGAPRLRTPRASFTDLEEAVSSKETAFNREKRELQEAQRRIDAAYHSASEKLYQRQQSMKPVVDASVLREWDHQNKPQQKIRHGQRDNKLRQEDAETPEAGCSTLCAIVCLLVQVSI